MLDMIGSGPPFSGRRCGWRVPLLILLAVLSYANILNNELFLDDLDYIVNNAYLRDWRYLPEMFMRNLTAGAGKASDYYRPAIEVVFAAGYHLWQLNPMGYHLLSVAFHAACAVLLYLFLSGLAGPAPAFWTAVFFAVHPVQTEAVASASALGILMGCFFGLAALLFHLRLRRSSSPGPAAWGLMAGAWLCAAVSLFCKETMVALPGAVFLLEYCFLIKEERPSGRFREALLRSLPFLATALAYVALRFTVLDFGGTGNLFRGENVFTQHVSVRFYTFLAVLVELVKLIFWPAHLFMERATVTPIFLQFWHLPVLAGFVLLAGSVGVAAVLALRPEPPVSEEGRNWRAVVPFGVFWFLFGLVPVSNVLIPISTTIVESWLYMPMIGVLLIVLSGALEIGGLWGGRGRKAVAALLSVLTAACLARTWVQNRVWRDPVSFYEHTLRFAPESARFRNNLAMAYADRKEYRKAVEQYQAAIRIDDEYPETHHNLGNTYLALGMDGEAEREFRSAIRMNPRFYHSYLALSALYLKHGRSDYARAVLEQLIANAPGRWEGYYNLGLLYMMKGDRPKAVSLWREGLKADPYNPTLNAALSGAR